jgi:hypothetical protein
MRSVGEVAKPHGPYQPSQSYLLPPSPHDWLPDDQIKGARGIRAFLCDVLPRCEASDR